MARPPPVLLLLAALLAGCDVTGVGVGTAVSVGSVAIIGRTPGDALVSLVAGRDCSVVRLDRGQGYCAPEEPPPAPPPFCTRSIGSIDCWAAPDEALRRQPPVAAGRTALTAAQDAHRTRRWPGLW